MIKLGSVINLYRGVSYKKDQSKKTPFTNSISLIRSTNINEGNFVFDDLVYIPRNLIDEEQLVCNDNIIMVMSSGSKAHVGKIAIAKKDLHCTFGAFCSKIQSINIYPKYLYYILLSPAFRQYIESQSKGTNINNIKSSYILDYEINLPPLPEQERIVAHIEELFSELDAGVETLKKTKAQLDVYRQAVLKEAFEGKLSSHRKVDLELNWVSNELIQELPQIPDEWQYIALSNLGDLGRGKSKHRPRNDFILFEDGKYPFIQTGEVKAAYKYITKWSKMYGEIGLNQSKLWKKGTLCITIAANIAETAFLDMDACFPDSVVGFTPSDNINPDYIKYFIDSQRLRLWNYAPATAQKNINLDTLENLIVPYCAVEEQKIIVSEIESRLSVCNNIEQTIDATLEQANALRHSILKEVFEGRTP